MGKAPASQFYWADFDRDTAVLSLAAVGGWMRLLTAMWWAPVRGEVSGDLTALSRILRCSETDAEDVISELVEMQVCDAEWSAKGPQKVREGNSEVTQETSCSPLRYALRYARVTLKCRRMSRERDLAQTKASKQFRYRQRKKPDGSSGNGGGGVTGSLPPRGHFVTHASSCSSSSSGDETVTPLSASPNLKSKILEEREISPARNPGWMSEPAIEIYRDIFLPEKVLSIGTQERIIAEATDLGRWSLVCRSWRDDNYRPGSIDKILSRYTERGNGNGKSVNGARAPSKYLDPLEELYADRQREDAEDRRLAGQVPPQRRLPAPET